MLQCCQQIFILLWEIIFCQRIAKAWVSGLRCNAFNHEAFMLNRILVFDLLPLSNLFPIHMFLIVLDVFMPCFIPQL